jgi:hypothetical protein
MVSAWKLKRYWIKALLNENCCWIIEWQHREMKTSLNQSEMVSKLKWKRQSWILYFCSEAFDSGKWQRRIKVKSFNHAQFTTRICHLSNLIVQES